jgi:hypothetical protein
MQCCAVCRTGSVCNTKIVSAKKHNVLLCAEPVQHAMANFPVWHLQVHKKIVSAKKHNVLLCAEPVQCAMTNFPVRRLQVKFYKMIRQWLLLRPESTLQWQLQERQCSSDNYWSVNTPVTITSASTLSSLHLLEHQSCFSDKHWSIDSPVIVNGVLTLQ